MILIQKLNELDLDGYKYIKNNDWGYPNNLLDYLSEHNFKRMGKGFFSEVWASETENFVVKINMGKYYDENYLKFIEYCHKNKGNKHLPKIGKIKTLQTIDGKNFYILFIEKLIPIHASDIGFDSSTDYNNFMIDICTSYQNHKNDLDILISDYCDHYNIYYDSYRKQIKELVKIYSDMMERVGKDNMDMETKNVMKRGNILIITDPVY